MTEPNSTLRRMAERAGDLYTLPAVAMEVLELTNNPQVDTAALKRCIETDPALTVKLLRVVNSSLYGLSREVSDLNQALALLGTKPLKLLVLGFSLPPGMFTGLTGDVLRRYWRHTLIKAVAARELAEKQSPESGDVAFIAGLLQDIGILLLVQELRDPYVSFVDRVMAVGGDLAELERRSLGFDHTMLTSLLLAQWKLPDGLIRAVSGHGEGGFERRDASSPDMPRLLNLADMVSRFLTGVNPALLADLLTTGDDCCALSAAQLEELLSGLKEKVVQLADVLSIEVGDDADYREILAEAHSRLAEVASDVAGEMVRKHCLESTPESETEALLADLEILSELITQVPDTPLGPQDAIPISPPQDDNWELPGMPAFGGADLTPRSDHVPAGAGEVERTGSSATIPADPGTLGQLSAAVAACRRNRCPLSLMLVELDAVGDLAFTYGVDGLDNCRRLLESACRGLDHSCTICLPHGEAGFAVVLPNCDRAGAVDLGHQLLERAKHLLVKGPADTLSTIGASIGIATLSLPSKNFPPEELFEAAARCLYGSHSSGGGVVKSIEIY